MRQYKILAAFTMCATLMVTGCGRSPEQTAGASANGGAVSPQASTAQAVETVTQFLDALRRGGSDTAAASLLTTAARTECQRKGIGIQPIGSPNARFQVTRGELLPGRTDAALVHSLWSEPNAQNGEPQAFEIVWALKQESTNIGWRISGMIVDVPGGEPTAVDFENGDELLSKLSGPAPAAETAASPATTVPR